MSKFKQKLAEKPYQQFSHPGGDQTIGGLGLLA